MESSLCDRRNRLKKALGLLLLLVSSLAVIAFTRAGHYFAVEHLQHIVTSAGVWAPIVFVLLFTVGACLPVPTTLLAASGAALFGSHRGFLYVWMGAMTGAGTAFALSRILGRDFVASLLGSRLQKCNASIERNGFATVLYLRLACLPFGPTSYAMGLTKVGWADFLLGTALGGIASIFSITFSVGTITAAWISNDWNQLLSTRLLAAVVIFLLSLITPTLLAKVR